MAIGNDVLRPRRPSELSKSIEPINVFDLPQLYTKPSFSALSAALESLKLKVVSWDAVETEYQPKEDINAIAAYLTKVVSNSLSWLSEEEQAEVWEEASSRLSERSGRTGMPSISRTFTIPSTSPSTSPLSISLHEPSLTGDNLGFKTWGSAFLLSQRLSSIASDHFSHLLSSPSSPRILELGSGTGLAGLCASALWSTSVTLTDLPVIVPNLAKNVDTNRPVVEKRGGSLSVQELDWSTVRPHHADFDVVLAADPLYSTEHPALLAPAVDGCLAHDEGARVLVGFPLRDEPTRVMGEELKDLLSQRGFELLHHGDEYGFDDWEVNGERASVHCWWGIWKRKMEMHNGADRTI